MIILLTAPPQTGKSTLVGKVLSQTSLTSRGIFSEEKLSEVDGTRVGFIVKIRSGEEKDFMTKNEASVHSSVQYPRVGSFIINTDVINKFIVPELEASFGDRSVELIYIDEIGRAQAHSDAFLQTVSKLFHQSAGSGKSILATIVHENVDWSMEFKQSDDVWLVEVTAENRDALVNVVDSMLRCGDVLESMSVDKRNIVRSLFYFLIKENQFVSAQKLFSNALQYSRTVVVPDPALIVGGETVSVQIIGKTDTHVVKYHVHSNECQCDCPLSCGASPFLKKEVCSHQLAIMIAMERVFF